MGRKQLKIIGLIGSLLCLTACRQSPVFYHYIDISSQGLGKGDGLIFTTEILDTLQRYNVDLIVRYNNEYPYTDLYLDLSDSFKQLKRDSLSGHTICIPMRKKDPSHDPQWEYIHQEIYAYQNGIRLHSKDTLTIRSRMKDELLPGVLNIGIEITPVHKLLKQVFLTSIDYVTDQLPHTYHSLPACSRCG